MKKIVILFSQLVGVMTAQNYCTPSVLPVNLQNGLIAFYPFCGNANDVSGNNYNGTVNNALLTTDRFGNISSAYAFNGTDSHILTTTPFMNASWNGYSISFWFNTNDLNKVEQNTFNTLPHNSIGIGYNYTGAPSKVIWGLNSDPNNISWDMITTSGSFSNYQANQWYHIVLVKNGSIWTQYLNGAVSCTASSAAAITNTLTNIHIGAIQYPPNGNYGEFFSGKLDDYLIYNRALTPQEVMTLYCLPPPPPTAISGETLICAGAPFSYSVNSVPGATAFNWTIPPGCSGSSNTNIISITALNGIYTLSVAATNSCGTSGSSTLAIQVSTCTSLRKESENGGIRLYPNPASDLLTLDFTSVPEKYAVRIIDLCGREVFFNPGLETNSIDISRLEAGIYCLLLETGSGTKSIRFEKIN